MSNFSGLAASATLFLLRRVIPRLSPGDRSWLARRLMQDRYNPEIRALAGFFDSATMAWKNRQYDVRYNGEEALAQRLAPFRPKVVLDVGANVGDWTALCIAHLPDAIFHAFEIADPTADELERNVAAFRERVVVNRFGLSDHDGEVVIYHAPESNTATSTVREALEVGAADHGINTIQELRGRVVTGDAYLEARGVGQVDLLKIDVEGAEPGVLTGFDGAFARGAVDVVQFEYGTVNLTTRYLLADFYAFFEARGFVLGKLLPEGVAFKPYEVADEDFVGPNLVAVRTARTDIIEALRCPPLTVA